MKSELRPSSLGAADFDLDGMQFSRLAHRHLLHLLFSFEQNTAYQRIVTEHTCRHPICMSYASQCSFLDDKSYASIGTTHCMLSRHTWAGGQS